MPDMTKYSGKKEFPSQTENRRQWILDVVRENQDKVLDILTVFNSDDDWFSENMAEVAKYVLDGMHKSDRDAILQPNGILTDEQIELLK